MTRFPNLRAAPLCAAVAMASVSSGAFAQSAPDPTPATASTHAAAPSPFLGQWELDLTRMPSTYGTPPKRVLYRFERIEGGKWRTTIDITGQDDSIRHMTVAYMPDGRAMQVEGEMREADRVAIMIPVPDVLVMNLSRDRQAASVRVYTIAGDGNAMIESAADIDANGDPFVRNFHYRRVR